ncbi:cupredoxin domain-containing protein [Candidatus Daviesbacteria bacterium]|nr:cupredoxin domain-containing protein [Candidatus Daviesbacteria bacterium]
MNRNLVVGLGIVLVVLIVGYFLVVNSGKSQTLSQQTPSKTNVSVTPSPAATGESSSSAQQQEAIVMITKAGFSPQTVSIKAGQTVTWVNNDSAPHQVDSSPHPQHTDYPPLNTIDLLKPGEKRSLAFPDKGSFRYHDHLNASLRGSVVAE